MFFFSLLSASLGDYIFGFYIHTNVVTLWVISLGLIQILFQNYSIPKWLLILVLYVFCQTFLLNINYINVKSSLSHFIAFVFFFVIMLFFVKNHRNKIISILRIYNNLAVITILLAILQIVIFILTKYTFLPQNLLSGYPTYTFESEIFNLIPRAPSFFSEPAHYSMFLLPSVYISILHLTNKFEYTLLMSKYKAVFLVLGMVFTFSIVGYISMIICLTSVFLKRDQVKKYNFRKYLIAFSFTTILLLLILSSPLSNKFTSLFNQSISQSDYNYTTSDLTGFALVSNTLVASKSLVSTYFLGSGFNSHSKNYDLYIGHNFTDKQIIMELNKEDAGSLYLRILSELGFPGLILFFSFLYKFKIKPNVLPKQSIYKFVNTLSLLMILCYCLRQGSYLSVFFLFFSSLYYYSYIEFIRTRSYQN